MLEESPKTILRLGEFLSLQCLCHSITCRFAKKTYPRWELGLMRIVGDSMAFRISAGFLAFASLILTSAASRDGLGPGRDPLANSPSVSARFETVFPGGRSLERVAKNEDGLLGVDEMIKEICFGESAGLYPDLCQEYVHGHKEAVSEETAVPAEEGGTQDEAAAMEESSPIGMSSRPTTTRQESLGPSEIYPTAERVITTSAARRTPTVSRQLGNLRESHTPRSSRSDGAVPTRQKKPVQTTRTRRAKGSPSQEAVRHRSGTPTGSSSASKPAKFTDGYDVKAPAYGPSASKETSIRQSKIRSSTDAELYFPKSTHGHVYLTVVITEEISKTSVKTAVPTVTTETIFIASPSKTKATITSLETKPAGYPGYENMFSAVSKNGQLPTRHAKEKTLLKSSSMITSTRTNRKLAGTTAVHALVSLETRPATVSSPTLALQSALRRPVQNKPGYSPFWNGTGSGPPNATSSSNDDIPKSFGTAPTRLPLSTGVSVAPDPDEDYAMIVEEKLVEVSSGSKVHTQWVTRTLRMYARPTYCGDIFGESDDGSVDIPDVRDTAPDLPDILDGMNRAH